MAVIADGMHSATDALSSLTGLVTNKLSDPRPIEIIPTATANTRRWSSASPVSSCSQPSRSCCVRRAAATPIRVTGQELVLLTLVLGFNSLAGYELREGRRLNSNLLKADARVQ